MDLEDEGELKVPSVTPHPNPTPEHMATARSGGSTVAQSVQAWHFWPAHQGPSWEGVPGTAEAALCQEGRHSDPWRVGASSCPEQGSVTIQGLWV